MYVLQDLDNIVSMFSNIEFDLDMVNMFCRYGVVFHGTREDHLEVTFHGEMRRYKLLHVLEFDATRKRMSVIIQKENGGFNWCTLYLIFYIDFGPK